MGTWGLGIEACVNNSTEFISQTDTSVAIPQSGISRTVCGRNFCLVSCCSVRTSGNKISSTLTCSPLAFNTTVHAVCRVPLRFIHLRGRLNVFLVWIGVN